MRKKNIAVIFGGQSNEYGVSLQSASAVLDNLDRSRYAPVMIGITKEGRWLRYQGSVERIRADEWHNDEGNVPAILSPCREKAGLLMLHDGEYGFLPIDAAFPVLHGQNGEDGRLQGLLELAGIPIAGCGMLSSAVCMDKSFAHRLVSRTGIRVPPSVVLLPGEEDAIAKIGEAGLRYPLYVKPAKSGSSIGITKVYAAEEVESAVAAARVHDGKVVIEQSIEGFEVGCAILGEGEELLLGSVDEIELSGEFFDFGEKYTLAGSIIHLPARVDGETLGRIRQTATTIYRTLGCRGMARVDLFVTPDKEIYFNEVNTIPGFTANSRFPKMLAAAGLTYGGIIDRLLDFALSGERRSHE